MGLFRKKDSLNIEGALPGRSHHNADGTRRRRQASPVSREAKKMTLLLIFNTVLSVLVYFALAEIFPYILFVYVALAVATLLAYVIYNRGFALRGVTPEMLPDTMTLEEKRAAIGEAADRMHRSRWMMTVLVPLIIAILFDIIYLYFAKDLIVYLDGVL